MTQEWERPVTVVELLTFVRSAEKVWGQDEKDAFIDYIARNPEAGVVVPATGGIRKVRWGREGSGKRGGVRVIYYFLDEEAPIFLITLYSKVEREDLSFDEKRLFADYVAELKRGLKELRG